MLLRYITFHREKVLYLTAACIFGVYISLHDACIPVVGKIGTNVTLNAVDVLPLAIKFVGHTVQAGKATCYAFSLAHQQQRLTARALIFHV